MSIYRTRQTLVPDTERECAGSRVVYAGSRSVVRAAVTEPCAVILVEAAMVRSEPAVLRWLVSMTTETVIGVVGSLPEHLDELADARLDAPVTESEAEGLVERYESRRAYAEAVQRYYQAVADGASEDELAAARRATDELAATLDAADRRAVLDAIGG